MGNAGTFDFPVRYHRVAGASPERVVRERPRELLAALRRRRPRPRARRRARHHHELRLPRPVSGGARGGGVGAGLHLEPHAGAARAPHAAPRPRVGIMTVDASSLRAGALAGAGITRTCASWWRGSRRRRSSPACMLDDVLELDVEAARASTWRWRGGSWPPTRRSARSCSSAPTCRRIAPTSRPRPGCRSSTSRALVRMVHDAVRHGLPPRPA